MIEADNKLIPAPLITLSELWKQNSSARAKREVNPIGVISYAEKQRMMIIGSYTDKKFRGTLVCVDRDIPNDFDPNQVFEGRDRIVDLSNYKRLKAAQVSLAAVEIATFGSIRTLPSVNVKIHTRNPINKQEEIVNIDEVELLRTLIGETGGIAVFSGTNLPEENALVLERNDDDDNSKSGMALFMYPDTDPITNYDSVFGLHAFVKKLNQEFIDTPYSALQVQALKAFDTGLRGGDYDFGGIEVREELFKAQIIANARLAARFKEPQYQNFLESHLPDLNTSGGARLTRRLFRGFGIKDRNFQTLAEESIDKSILRTQSPHNSTPLLSDPNKETENNFFLKLKTPEARNIWQKVGNYYRHPESFAFKNGEEQPGWIFLGDLVRFVANAQSLNEIDDSITSLQHLQDWNGQSLRLTSIVYYMDLHHDPEPVFTRENGTSHQGRELIQYLMSEAIEKKIQIQKSFTHVLIP